MCRKILRKQRNFYAVVRPGNVRKGFIVEKILRLGIIGCGRVAFHHAEMLKGVAGIELVAACDLIADKAKALADKAGLKAYTNYREMLKSEALDVVTLATPTGAHYDHVKDILNCHPVHVLLEKPMVLRIAHGMELNALAQARGVRIFPVYQNRFNKAVQRVKTALINGELGDVVLGTVRLRWCRPQRYYDLASWRGTFSMDGGAHVNQGIHYIDILRYLAGEIEEVHSLFAQLGAKLEAEDTGVSIVRFKNGGLGQIEITMAARPDDFEASVSIVGSKGMAVLGGICANKLETFSPAPADQAAFSEEVPMAYGISHRRVYEKIVAALRDGKPSPVAFEDGIKTIKLLHALYCSNEQRRWVRLDEEVESARLGERNEKLLSEYLIG
ncbi:MAG: Gfo/Idh/MocA family oxidoreductase [Candidatus Omnitrophica bacterium]|nr:Gfo/Idh/MocA family oxidoreductase [Candidatus Omnitrophota bacterium]